MTATHEQQRPEMSLDSARSYFASHGLTRPRQGRLIGGVTAGFARRFSIDLLVARVAAIAGVIILTPFLYLPLWVLMPQDAPAAG